MPNVSVFMIFELLTCFVVESDYLLQSMTQIFTSKLLCRVPRIFVQSFFETDCRDGLTDLPQSFVSEDDTAVIVCEETTALQLVTTTNYCKFYF